MKGDIESHRRALRVRCATAIVGTGVYTRYAQNRSLRAISSSTDGSVDGIFSRCGATIRSARELRPESHVTVSQGFRSRRNNVSPSGRRNDKKIMAENEHKAMALIAEAEKKLGSSKGFFGSLFG